MQKLLMLFKDHIDPKFEKKEKTTSFLINKGKKRFAILILGVQFIQVEIDKMLI